MLKKRKMKKKRKPLNQENKVTVGKAATDLLSKNPEVVALRDISDELLSDYEKNVLECIKRGVKELDSDFYIVVLTKKEKLLKNVLRHFFLFRQSCPTPNYDQTVYQYKHKDEDLLLLWTIPSRDASVYLLTNAKFVDPSEWKLLNYVLKFANKDLYKLSKKLNKEI